MGFFLLWWGFPFLFVAPAWPGVYVDSVSWTNGAGVYDINHNAWSGDDFNGSGSPAIPPYFQVDGAAYMSQSGGKLDITRPTAYSGYMNVYLPNFNASGSWQPISNATLIANFQNGAPVLYTAYGINIRTPSGTYHTELTVGTLESGTFIVLIDNSGGSEPGEPKAMMPLSGFTALGLKIHVDAAGNCTYYYMMNPGTGFIDPIHQVGCKYLVIKRLYLIRIRQLQAYLFIITSSPSPATFQETATWTAAIWLL